MAINYNLGDLSNINLGGLTGQTLDQMAQGYGSGDLGGIGASLAQQQGVTPTSTGISYEEQKRLDEANYQNQLALQKQQQKYESDLRERQALEAVQAAFDQYGLSSLYPKIVEYAKAGYSADLIVLKLRETPEYKARFPAMDALAKKGRAISESAYIEYERTAAALEQRYGMPKGMIMGSVTDLLTAEVSAAELNDRIVLASASSLEASQELRDTLKDYYGVDQGALAAYYLDPDKALPLLEKQYATAQIGSFAKQQGMNFGLGLSSELRDMGVTEAQARDTMGTVAERQSFTVGRGDTATMAETAKGAFGDAESQQAVQRTAGSRVNRFAQGGGFASGQQGVSGLGSSNA